MPRVLSLFYGLNFFQDLRKQTITMPTLCLPQSMGCTTTNENREAAAASDVVVVCVKPNIVGRVLTDLKSCITPARPLVTSVALGVTLSAMEAALPPEARVVRIMPNTPALVELGASVFSRGTNATNADAELTQRWVACAQGVLCVFTLHPNTLHVPRVPCTHHQKRTHTHTSTHPLK